MIRRPISVRSVLLGPIAAAVFAATPLTAAPGTTPCDTLRIAFLTDIHVTPGNRQDSLLRVAINEINTADYDAVIFGGDLTNMGSDRELENVHAQMVRLNRPWCTVSGNHETTWSESAGATFRRLFGHDGRVAFRIGGYLFLGYAAGPYMKMADGGIRAEDLAWIEREVAAARPGERIVSLCHYPLTDDLTNRPAIVEVLRRSGIGLSLCGHYHRLDLRNFDGITGVQGRALHQGEESFGYTRLEFYGDSLRIAEKRLGEAPRTVYTLRQEADPQVLALPCAPATEQPDESAGRTVIREAASVFTGVDFAGDTLFYATSQGVLKAYDTRSGKTVWQRETNGAIYSTPCHSGGVVVVGTATEGLRGYDIATGADRWRLPARGPVIGDGLVDGKMLYIGPGDGSMAKISIADGRIVWRFDYGEGQAQGRPTLGGGKLVFGAWDTHLYCLDAERGELCWKWSNGSSQRLFSPGHVVPQIANGRVFIVAPDRYVTCLDLESGREIWRVKQRRARESTGISPDGRIFYFKTMDGELVGIDTSAETYREVQVTDTGWGYDHNSCPVAVYGDLIYLANRTGRIAVVRTDGTLVQCIKPAVSAANDFRQAPDGSVWVTFAEGSIVRLENGSNKTDFAD